MRTIQEWKDLEPEGIFLVTGESCPYAYRVLCDVTGCGLDLLARLLGTRGDLERRKKTAGESLGNLIALLPDDDPRDLDCQNVAELVESVEPLMLNESWNGVPGARWSILLPRELFQPLAVFALIRAGCGDVFALDNGPVFGFEEAEQADRDAHLKRWRAQSQSFERIHNPGYARHPHPIAGRIE